MFSFPFKKNKNTTAAYEEKPFFDKEEQVFLAVCDGRYQTATSFLKSI